MKLTADDIFELEHSFSGSVASKKKLGQIIDGMQRCSRLTLAYSQLVNGASVVLGDAVRDLIPAGAVIRRVFFKNSQAWAGDGTGASTVSLGVNTAVDLLAAVAVSNAALTDTAATHDGIPQDAAANRVVVTADCQLTAKLTVNATDTKLTAGVMNLYVVWDPPPVVYG